jgi:hypothetical protein
MAGEEDSSPQLLAAMEALDIWEQETIHLDTESAAAGDAVIIEPAPPPPNAVQVVLYQDEAGALSWHLADGAPVGAASDPPVARLRGGRLRDTFTIPTRTAGARTALRAEPASARLRGFITILGRKVFKVLILPLVSEWFGQPLRKLVTVIESHYRREMIRPLSLLDYRKAAGEEFSDWQALRGKRALLVVHGIFSTTEGMLSRFPETAMEALQTNYEGRMIALDQLTVSSGPEDNARNFLTKAKAALGRDTVEFDILCHSRGGIVSRALVERGHEIVPDHPCRFKKVFFAGTPNSGSQLADPDHMVTMIDAFTNFATAFPDGFASYALELLLGLVKLLVHSGERHLAGAAAMSTLSDQYITKILNSAQPSAANPKGDYAAVSSDFNPTSESGLAWRLANQLVDRIFHTSGGDAISNDLVVPSQGVYRKNGHSWFPIEKLLLFEAGDGVKHTDYFAQPQVVEAIHWHFGVPGAQPPAGMMLPAQETVRLRSSERAETAVSLSATPAETQPAVALRKPGIEYHEVIEAGRTEPIKIFLQKLIATDPAAEKALRIALSGEGTAILSVKLSAPGFDIVDPDTLPLLVRNQAGGPDESVSFIVTPRDPGPKPILRELSAGFWQGTHLLGSVTHRTAVVPVGWTGPLPEGYGSEINTGVRFSSVPRRNCELALNVISDDRQGISPFKLSLRSEIPGEAYENRAAGIYNTPQGKDSLEEYLSKFFSDNFKVYPPNGLSDEDFAKALPKWEEKFLAELGDLGRTLWQWLPQEFRSEYLRLHKAGVAAQSILIASEEMVLPWELVVPTDEQGNTLPALGRAHVIGRWNPSWVKKPEPQRLRVKTGCLLSPTYTGRRRLRKASAEVAAVQSLMPRISLSTGSDLATVRRDVLNATDLQLLHFVGHGEFNMAQADDSALVLGDDDFLKARSFTGSALAGKASPVLYLNACAVGQNALVVGRPGGFSANFLRSGGTGVIAPYWPVNDESAAAFAQALYGKLLHNRSVGEALRELRDEHPKDSTFQAFAWFGDPWASLDLNDLQ